MFLKFKFQALLQVLYTNNNSNFQPKMHEYGNKAE